MKFIAQLPSDKLDALAALHHQVYQRPTYKTVCVVGLGPAGLTAVKELKAQGLEVTGYDRAKSVGGIWARDGPGVWKELYLNSTRAFTEFSDFPWRREDYIDRPGVLPDRDGIFPHWTEASAYLEDYAKHFKLEDYCQLDTGVLKIEQMESGWNVTTVKTGKETTSRFDALVMCQGGHACAYNPFLTGDGSGILDTFEGQVLHSSEVRSLADLDGRRVLSVGSSVSATDLASQLAERGKATTVVNSVRRVPYVVNWTSPVNGKVKHAIMGGSRGAYWRSLNRSADKNAADLKATILENFPLQITAEISGSALLVPDEDVRKAGVAMAYNYIENLRDGKLHVKPAMVASEGRAICFADGTKENFDVVICGTGFEMDVSSLPKDVQDEVAFVNPFTKKQVVALYKHTLVPNIPNLAFSGFFHGSGPTLAAIEMCSRFVGQVFSGRLQRPPEWKIAQEARRVRDLQSEGRHLAEVPTISIQEDLGSVMGVAPSCWQCVLHPDKLLRAPAYPSGYRVDPNVDGKHGACQALDRFEWCLANPELSRRPRRPSKRPSCHTDAGNTSKVSRIAVTHL